MAGNNVINYDIKFNADTSNITSQVNQLRTTLQNLNSLTTNDMMKINMHSSLSQAERELQQLKSSIATVESAFNSAFNKDLGTLNIAKFNQTLKTTEGGIKGLYAGFNNAGAAGQNAFRNVTSQILTTNLQLKQTNGWLTDMATTMANTVKWGIASSVMNNFTGTVKKAYGYVKHLDGSLNDIRIVTGKSSDEMDKFAEKANKAAQSLGQTTNAYTEAALIYYQQGLSDVDVEARANVTLKAANVTGQTGEEVSEQLTAVWNGYKVSAEESELYIDKLAAVAANSASNLEELSTGMSKVASAANAMGVDVDQLNAQLSTIISVTRQAPESVGTALKTIYARMSDLKLGKTDEDGLGLGDVSGTMESMGIDVMDATGNLRDMGNVIEDVAKKWGTWTEAQQTAMAQAMAGKRQYNNLVALFENWDMYEKSKDVSEGSAGTLQKQQDTYMESTAAHLQQLKAEWEDLYDSLLDTDSINGVADALKAVVGQLTNFVDSIGGGIGLLTLLGSVGLKVFSKQIAGSLANTIMNFQKARENASQLQAEMEIMNQYKNSDINDARTLNLIAMKKEQLDLNRVLTAEEKNITNEMIRQKNELYQEQDALKERLNLAAQTVTKQGGATWEGQFNVENVEHRKILLAYLEEEETAYKRMQASFEGYAETAHRLQGAITTKTRADTATFAEAGVNIENLTTRAQNSILGITEFARGLDQTTAEAQELTAALAEYNSIQNFDPQNTKHVEALRRVLLGAETAYKKVSAANRENVKQAKNYDKAMKANGDSVKALEAKWKNFINTVKLKSAIQGVLNLTSALGSVAMIGQSIKRMGEIWDDDTLSRGDKVAQIMMSVSMTAGMAATALKSFGGVVAGVYKTVTGLYSALSALTMAQKISAAWTNEETRAEVLKNVAQKMGIRNAEKQTAAKLLNSIADKLGIKNVTELTEKEALLAIAKKLDLEVTEDMTEATLFKMIAEKQGVVVTEKAGKAEIAHTAYMKLKEAMAKKLNITLFGLQLTMGKLLIITGALIAIFVAIGVAVNAAAKAQMKEEEALKASTEAAEKQREALDRVRAANENLKKSLEDYQKSKDAISTLTKGTEEWRDAINEANQGIYALLQSYPELAAFISNVDGQLFLDTEAEGFKEFQENRRKTLVNAQIATNVAEADLLEKEMDVRFDHADFKYNVNTGEKDEHSYTGISEANIRKIVDVINTEGSGFLTDPEAIAKKLDLDPEIDKTLITAIQNYAVELGELADNIKINTTAIDTYYSIAADNYLQDNQQYQNSNVQEGLSSAAGAYLQEKQKELYETKWKDKGHNGNGITDEEVQLLYGKLIGASHTENLDDNKGKYFINGEWQEIDDSTARMALAMDEATDGLGAFTAELITTVTALSGDDANIANALLDYFDDGKTDLSNLTTEQLKNFGTNFDDVNMSDEGIIAQAKQLGFEDEVDEEGNVTKNAAEVMREKVQTDVENERIRRETSNAMAVQKAMIQDGYTPDQDLDVKQMIADSKVDLNAWEGISPEQIISNIDFSQAPTDKTGLEEWFQKAAQEGAEKAELDKLMQNKIAQINAEAEELDLDTKELTNYANHLQDVAEESDIVSDELKDNEAAAQIVSKSMTRMNRGIDTLADNYKDWTSVLKKSDKASKEYADAMGGMKEAVADLLDMEKEWVSSDFITSHLEDIKKASNGNAEAIERLKIAAAQDIVKKVTVDFSETEQDDFVNRVAELGSSIPEIKVGATLDDGDFLTKAQQLIEDCNMTVDEANAMFDALGFEANFATEEKKVTSQKPVIKTVTEDYSYDKPNSEGGTTHMTETKTYSYTEGYTPVEETILVPAMSTNGETPIINSITRKSSGSMNNYSSSNSGGGKPGKGSGGGGGDKKPEKIDKMESEIDRYHDVENELKKLNTLLERQERISSKLTGKDRIAAIQKQISLLQEQNEKQKEKLKLMQEEAAELKKKLQGEGVKFDAEGDISNYKALLKAKEDEINNMIDEANSKSSADAQEKIKEDIENAKEEYEKLREWIERYETLMYDEMPGLEDEMQEAWDKQIELQIEAFEIEIKLKLDLQDTKRQLNEFMREVIEGIEDDEYGKIQEYIAKDLPTYFGETGTAQANYDALQKALKEYQTIKNGGIGEIFGDDANAAWEKVMELKDATLDSLSEVKDLIDQMEENYLNAIEAASEKFAEHLEQYEHIQSILDHNIKLIEMLAGDEAYDAQLAYYNQMERKNLGQVDEARRILEFWRQQKAAAEEGSEAWKEANAKEQEAQEQLNALVEQSVETIKTKYEKTVSKIIKDLNSAVTNGKGLDALSQEWELINQEADMYLDTVNSAYEIQKLENKLIDAIDNASSLKAKQRLNELMEKELGMLKDKDKLSQYEVDRANQLLDIEMKKIALEEAQRNKSTMRLRRDAQGNYSYQYVTDNDAVAKAQEELNEAQNSLYNLDKDAYKENLDQILSLWTDFQTKLNEIWTNNNLTEEQKQQQAYNLRERYMRMITSLTYDNENIRLNLENSAFYELARLRGMDIQDFQNMADEEKRILLEQIIPQWNSGLQEMANQFSNEDGFVALINQAFTGLQQNLKDYQDSLKNLEEAAGINFQTIISGAQDLSKETQKLVDQNKTIVDEQAKILDGLRKNIDATKKWVKEFEALAAKTKEALDLIIQLQEEENKKDSNKSDDKKKDDNKSSSSSGDNSSHSSRNSGSSDTAPTSQPEEKSKKKEVKFDKYKYKASSRFTYNSFGHKTGREAVNKIYAFYTDGSKKGPVAELTPIEMQYHPIYKDISSFKTGGYTGEWANGDADGRLTMLHQKELVLNSKDTKNILAAVDVVRSLNDSLTSRITNLFNPSSIDKLIQLFEKDSNPLEQNVQITANFPNVSVEREIEEAFNSLISSASQYAFNTLK